MSELRKIEIPVDERIFESVGRELGLRVERQAEIRGYSTQGMIGSPVICGNRMDIGVVTEGNTKRIVYDDMCKEAQDVMTHYMDKYITKKLRGRITSKREMEHQVIYLVNV
ncbi:hypothetical protein DRN93_02930 [archaeon]|nr:MAG: hypothetical protein DRN93_02930 [archaeon]